MEYRDGDLNSPPPRRTPKWGFGQTLRDKYGFVGRVDSMYADYYAATYCFVIPPDWFQAQQTTPSTKDQVFYGIVGLDGIGTSLVGENDAVEV